MQYLQFILFLFDVENLKNLNSSVKFFVKFYKKFSFLTSVEHTNFYCKGIAGTTGIIVVGIVTIT